MRATLLSKKNLLAVIVIFLFLGVGLFLFILFNEPAPQLFPFNNPQAEYIIEKSDGGIYTVSYKDSQQDIKEVMIGNSLVDLTPFIGKRVQIQGKFENRKDTQCIAGQCQFIYGPYVALDINSIQEK